MIRSFACEETQALFNRERIRKIPESILRTALRKLRLLDAAVSLEDLKIPPGNRLEKLQGDWSGYYSIRINDQWRLCFRFDQQGASDVEIMDYH